MSLVNFKTILSCSSEDRVHCAKNLLKLQQNKKWLSSKGTEERIICILEFEKPSFISTIDIGNDGSAFIELLVSRSSSSKTDDWTVLLPPTALMTAVESHSNINRNQVKSIKSDLHVNEKWNRLKIICEQKFNHSIQFGLNFIKLYIEDEIQQNKLSSSFAKSTSTDDIDKSQIMKDVIFVISGFQNPLRTELRNKATSMGASCNEHWNDTCTHLICAFPSTPKLVQVQQTGKGLIVNKQWILDCDEQSQLLSEKSYEVKRNSETKKKKTSKKKKAENTNEEETNKKTFGEIPDFFNGKHFYVSYGDYNDDTLLDITRVILAYDGILERQINSDVTYVITNRIWNQDFDKISKNNSDINFVNLDWLQDCHDANQLVPLQPYLIVP